MRGIGYFLVLIIIVVLGFVVLVLMWGLLITSMTRFSFRIIPLFFIHSSLFFSYCLYHQIIFSISWGHRNQKQPSSHQFI